MSSNFIRRFLGFTKVIFVDKLTRDISIGELGFRFGICSTILAGHGIYVFSTEKTDAIVVEKKYKMNRHGFTDFMIVDEDGRHFNVNNSLWYWKWNSIEDWHKIDEKKQILIKYYGWRVPVLGFFPNIVISNKAEFLDSMSSAEFRRFEAEKLI